MPRSPDGSYTLPLPDVAPGEVISSTWANTTMNDIAQSLGDSLDRDGNGGMRAPLQFGDGVVAAPGITWSNEVSTGIYRAGTGDMRISVLGVNVFRWNNGKAQQWNGTSWVDVLLAGGAGTVPNGSVIGQTVVWDGSKWVATKAASANVTYDPAGNLVLTATNVQAALGQVDGVLNAYNLHAADDTIHWDDVPIDDVVYNRRNGAWIPSVAGVSDHDQLNGLTVGDDHPQYLNNARGDARYPLKTAYNAHVADASIHFADAPANGTQYARKDNAWEAVAGGSTPMIGEMRLFNGNLSNLQPGWYLCNGSNGTPDLRGRMVFAAGGAYTQGVSAGATAVTRNVASGGSHTHGVGIQTSYSNQSADGGGDHKHNLVSTVVQSGTGKTVAAFAQTSLQGSDHSHPVIGNTGSGGSHLHSLTDADPPHYVITGFIMYTGVI